MDPELSTKVRYLTTLYQIVLQIILGVLYAGKTVAAIIEGVGKGFKLCFTSAIKATRQEMSTSPLPESPNEGPADPEESTNLKVTSYDQYRTNKINQS